jgi:photosystem II stability/assembly factor-like uncharacterized protein
MHDLSCRAARLLLQAPADLSLLDTRALERHLLHCADCESFRRRQSALDAAIRLTLSAATDGTSVRAQVRSRLQASARPAPRRFRFRLPLKPLWAAVPTAIAAVLVFALVLPHLFGSHQTAPTVYASQFKPKRIGLGYPVTLDPSRPAHVLVGAGGEVYESWDAGNSYRQLAPLPKGFVIRDLAIDSTDPHRYVVAALRSILVSEDAGRHWRVTATGLLGAFNVFLTQQPTGSHPFFVGPSILWKSADHGHTWAPAGPGSIFGTAGAQGIQALTFAPNGDLYTAIWNGGVALSRDGGVTWQRRSNGLARTDLNVTVGPTGTLWTAAASHGVYRSTDGGLHWQHVRLPVKLYTTAVIDQGSYILAGGNGGVFRSTDGGRHWSIADDGLPLASYVFGFAADQQNPSRVYASLDDDLVWRSDDGGLHWQNAHAGIPPTNASGSSLLMLFRRGGGLWYTDGLGADPGNLTVDNNVVAAAGAPDGASIAYVTGSDGGWWLRAVPSGAGGAARTVAAGADAVPRQILWSADASLIGVVNGVQITVAHTSGAGGRAVSWRLPAGGTVLAWSRDARSLLVWDRSGHVTTRAWATGSVLATLPGAYALPPAVAPNGRQIALVREDRLLTGSWGTLHPVATVPPQCIAGQWSDDSSRFLLSCAHGVQERLASGARAARVPNIPAGAFWVPFSDTDLLFFRSGTLWRWSPPDSVRALVTDAHGVHGVTSVSGVLAAKALTPPCSAANLTADIAFGAATGSLAGRVELTNHGSVCALRGYPEIAVLDGSGRPLVFTRSHLLPASLSAAGVRLGVHTVRLANGDRSDVEVWWSNWCQGTATADGVSYPVPGPLSVRLTLPNGQGVVVVSWSSVSGGSPATGPRCDSGPGSTSRLQTGPFTTSPQ